MRARAGMTLVEVLAALVLLAMLAAASASMLRAAAGSMPSDDADPFELASLADAILADPGSHGITVPLHELLGIEIALADRPGHAVTVRVVRSVDPEAAHAWVVFEASTGAVSRWIELPEGPSP